MQKKAERIEIILNIIEEKEQVQISEILVFLGKSGVDINQRTLLRDLNDLLEKKLVSQDGAGRNTYYFISATNQINTQIDVQKYFSENYSVRKAKHTFNYHDMKNGEWKEDKIKVPNKQMRSVWSVNMPRPKEKLHGKHPTQKPIDLLRRIILASTNIGDLILDPFTGSSTTGIAAYENGRRFIGIDMEKEYLDLSIKRFESIL